MKHIFCWIALGCASICYVQRCIEDKYWLTVPLSFLIVGASVVGVGGSCLFLLEKFGWIKLD